MRGLIVGLMGAAVVGGIAFAAWRDSENDGTTECYNPLVLDTWGKAVGANIIILNTDGTFYQMVGIGTPTTGYLVWKAGTTQFRVSPDDDWEGARASPPQSFPWEQASVDRLATTNFNRWCANPDVQTDDAISIKNINPNTFKLADKVNASVFRGGFKPL